MVYLTESHRLVIAREEAEGRLKNICRHAWRHGRNWNELALLQRRATFERGH